MINQIYFTLLSIFFLVSCTTKNIDPTNNAPDGKTTVYISSLGDMVAIDGKTATEKWRFSTDGFSTTSPIVINGVIYFGNSFRFYAIDVKTGLKKWEFEIDGIGMSSSPFHYKGILYFGNKSGFFYALDLNGKLKWKKSGFSTIRSSPIAVDGVIVFGSYDNNIYALDANTGAEKWHYKTNSTISSTPTNDNGVVYIGSWDGKFYAFDIMTGQKKWEYNSEKEILSNSTILNGVIYFMNSNNFLFALDSFSGKFINKTPIAEAGDINVEFGPVAYDNKIFFSNGDSYLRTFDPKTQVYKKVKSIGYVLTTPTIADETVYIGTKNGYIEAFNSNDLTKIWSFNCSNSSQWQPPISESICVVTSDGKVYRGLGNIHL